MPRLSSRRKEQFNRTTNSEVLSTQETIFLLSVSRDEDDAAALRADLKRSTLGNYKIQHCANLDDALHLMRVCGFDLVFIRLDDFQDKQGAVDLIKQIESDQSIVAMATSRLLSHPGFELPEGIDATCRLEDMSPSLIANLVVSTIERKFAQRRQSRLEKELQLALNAGQLGSWVLDIESGVLDLDTISAAILDLPPSQLQTDLDRTIDLALAEDQEPLKRAIAAAIDQNEALVVSFRLKGDSMPLAKVEMSGSPLEMDHPGVKRFFGVFRRSNPYDELYDRIASANSAIERAFDERDQAILAAKNELMEIAKELKETDTQPVSTPVEPPSPRDSAALQSTVKSEAKPLPVQKTASDLVAEVSKTAPETPPALLEDPDSAAKADKPELSFNKQAAFQNVLKSLGLEHQQKLSKKPEEAKEVETVQDTFPFDFSSESSVDYSEPDPHSEGFIGAAKRLVAIIEKGHDLKVSLNLEKDSAIETECEKDLVFEILRELLTNVVKHARAQQCIIALFRDEDEWVLQVEDDGIGLENNLVAISTPLNQIGLFRIRTKLALKGGQLDLSPTMPCGLAARVRLPVCLTRPNPHQEGAERA